MKTLKSLVAILLVGGIASFCGAATINVPETFGDGGVPEANGWGPNDGSVVADAGDGGVGDHALDYIAANDPMLTNGFHLLHPAGGAVANPVFQGDYLAAGATAIRFKARHSGIGDLVTLRGVLFDDFADGTDWVSSVSSVAISPNFTTWQTYELSLLPANFVAGGDNGRSVNDILTAVVQVGLRHDPAGTGPTVPASVASPTSVLFDDIVLVPEPSAGVLLLLGLIAGLTSRRPSRV